MKHLGKLALGAMMMAGTAIIAVPARAGVSVGIGIGLPVPAAPPCAYDPYYCGYYSYSSPVFVGGTWWYGPHYYRWWGGRSWVWWHGGWHSGFGGGWRGRGWHGGGWHR
jgi:hypothetical protein